MNIIFKFLIKLSNFNRSIDSITLRIFKLFNRNRGYFKVGKNVMFLDFLDPIDRKIIISHKYEQNEISTLHELTRNFSANYFLDIGANNGFYSIKFAQFYNDIKIMAFEPNNEAYFKFKKTLDLNKNFSKRITLYNFGLSDKNSKEKMRSKVKYGYAQTGGSTIHDGKKYDDVVIYDASFKVADEFLNIKNSNLILKIDTEGHELKVLKGLEKIISQNNCILQIEIFDRNFEIINSFLLKNNFRKLNTEIYNCNYFYSKTFNINK